MTEANAMLLVLQTPRTGREDEHRDWYLSTHLPDVCAVPGVLRGEYASAVPGPVGSRWSNAAVYWLDGDPAVIVNEVFRRAGAGEMKLSDTLDPERTMMAIATALTPRRTSDSTVEVDAADRQLYIVLTNATEGDDDAFNAWYDGTHLGDVLAVPGFTAAQRFRLVDHPALKPCPYRYLAIYEVASAAAADAFAEMADRAGSGRMVLSPTLDRADVYAVAFASEGSCSG